MDQRTIDSLIEYLRHALLRNGLNDAKIAIFGSALREEMSQHSDIDLIIISKDFEGMDIFQRAKSTIKAERETLRKYMIPLDILTYTPGEYNNSTFPTLHGAKIVA